MTRRWASLSVTRARASVRSTELSSWTPDVEPKTPRGDEWVAGEPGIGLGVGHYQHVVGSDGDGAERRASVLLPIGQAQARLGPQPVGVDQVDQRDGHVEEAGGEAGQAVEALLRRRVEQTEVAQCLETLLLVWWQRRTEARAYLLAAPPLTSKAALRNHTSFRD